MPRTPNTQRQQHRRSKAELRPTIPALPQYRDDRRKGNRGGEWRKTEHRAHAAGAWCKLGCPPMFCECRIVLQFTEAEYECLPMRLAVYDFARSLEWSSRDWLAQLLKALHQANVHFKDERGQIFDLDVSCFEGDGADGDTEDAIRQFEALRVWFRQHFLRKQPYTLAAMPELSDKGKERFMTTASILIAAYAELEDDLIHLANEGPVFPRLSA